MTRTMTARPTHEIGYFDADGAWHTEKARLCKGSGWALKFWRFEGGRVDDIDVVIRAPLT